MYTVFAKGRETFGFFSISARRQEVTKGENRYSF
jgi:hypothetical protein